MYCVYCMVQVRRESLVTSMELARMVGVTPSTIYYYTVLGLLHVRQKRGNRRLYDLRQAKKHLKEVRRLQQEGYSLTLIRNKINGKGSAG